MTSIRRENMQLFLSHSLISFLNLTIEAFKVFQTLFFVYFSHFALKTRKPHIVPYEEIDCLYDDSLFYFNLVGLILLLRNPFQINALNQTHGELVVNKTIFNILL